MTPQNSSFFVLLESRVAYVHGKRARLDTTDDLRPLALELEAILLVALLFAVFQSGALVVFEHAMSTAKVAVAEAAVADDALGKVFAVGGLTAELFGRHFSVCVSYVCV